MAEHQLVSIVIPTRNRRAAIERALRALTLQTYPDFEIIAVDDNSSDGTPELLSDLATGELAGRLRILRNVPQRGANPSRNRGISASKGDLIAFLDDDCIPAPDWLERTLAEFTSPNVAAVTGRIDDPPPTNIFELTFHGTHRVYGRRAATRLVAGNMCIRKDILARVSFDEDRAGVAADTSVSGRGDEEGLYLLLRAAGYEVRVAPMAAVLHEHPYRFKSFVRQAYRGGKSAARVGYKYRLAPRVELAPLLITYMLLPIVLYATWLGIIPAITATAFLGAVIYNEIARKGKTIFQLVTIFPTLMLYYHLRLCGYVIQLVRLYFGIERIERVNLSEAGAQLRKSDKSGESAGPCATNPYQAQ